MAEPKRYKAKTRDDDPTEEIIVDWSVSVDGETMDGEEKFVVHPMRIPTILLMRLGELSSVTISSEVIADTMSPIMQIFRACFATDWDRFYALLADPSKRIDAEATLMPIFEDLVKANQTPRPTQPSAP